MWLFVLDLPKSTESTVYMNTGWILNLKFMLELKSKSITHTKSTLNIETHNWNTEIHLRIKVKFCCSYTQYKLIPECQNRFCLKFQLGFRWCILTFNMVFIWGFDFSNSISTCMSIFSLVDFVYAVDFSIYNTPWVFWRTDLCRVKSRFTCTLATLYSSPGGTHYIETDVTIPLFELLIDYKLNSSTVNSANDKPTGWNCWYNRHFATDTQ